MNLFFPNIAYAASESLDKFIQSVNGKIINPLIVFLFALALVYFLWGVFSFISNNEEEEKRTAGKRHMIWGIIGMTVMIGVWTILSILMNTFNIQGIDVQKGTVTLPAYDAQYPPLGN